MKKLIIIFLSISSFSLSAQDYLSAMQNNLKQLDAAETPQNYTGLALSFERIAVAEQTKWHPYYYQAFCLLAKSFLIEGADDRDKLVDAAEAIIEKAGQLGGDKAELSVLQARAYQARLSVDPASRSMQYGPKTTMLLAEARAKNPNNPRVLFLLGQNLLFTPEGYGGGKDRALPLIEKAVAIFNTAPTEPTVDPSWGRDEANSLLANAKK
ncbi:MAG: hypothetical protein SH848_03925 [Saprospiraceae bacterium]|nr:hypothetical protein [Saprospiraceae bacterium]MDZ4703049.1 hypothetical protein [Saprospiraceae bacterium]